MKNLKFSISKTVLMLSILFLGSSALVFYRVMQSPFIKLKKVLIVKKYEIKKEYKEKIIKCLAKLYGYEIVIEGNRFKIRGKITNYKDYERFKKFLKELSKLKYVKISYIEMKGKKREGEIEIDGEI